MNHSFSWVPEEKISTEDETFRVRTRYSPVLAESVRRAGIRTPLLVQPREDGRLRLVSGWGRWRARPQGEAVPCFLLPEAASPEELWNVFLRDNDTWNVVEVARVLERLRTIPGMTAEAMIREKLPLLGFNSSKELYRRHLQLLDLPDSVLDFIEESELPLRRAGLLFKLSGVSQERFIAAARRMRLTLNECSEALEWLANVARREGVAAHRILEDLLGDGDPPDKLGFRRRLRERRYPELHSYHQRLRDLQSELRFTVPVEVSWDWRLETPGLRLLATVADGDALRTLEQELAANRRLLQCLLEIL